MLVQTVYFHDKIDNELSLYTLYSFMLVVIGQWKQFEEESKYGTTEATVLRNQPHNCEVCLCQLRQLFTVMLENCNIIFK